MYTGGNRTHGHNLTVYKHCRHVMCPSVDVLVAHILGSISSTNHRFLRALYFESRCMSLHALSSAWITQTQNQFKFFVAFHFIRKQQSVDFTVHIYMYCLYEWLYV